MDCPQCATANPDQARFCFNCGHNFSETKPSVPKTKEMEYSKYIPEQLLQKIQSSSKIGGLKGERRIVTVLFCDIEGSTAAAETLDPEDWAEIVNGAFDQIIPPVYEYEGIIARLMGDGILAFFGAPISHEDDPERAVLAAMNIRANVQSFSVKIEEKWGIPINVRVGINTGLVVVGEIGSDLRVEYTAMGDAINIASRMESTATPGTIRITEDTFKRVSYLFEADKVGAVSVKGKRELVTAYEITRKRSKVSKRSSNYDLTFVGREQELEIIRSQFNEDNSSEIRVVAISGDAGIGKSRLVREFQNLLLVEGYSFSGNTTLHWLETSAFSYQQTIPFVPFIDLMNRQLKIDVDMDATAKWDLLNSHLQGILGEESIDVATHLGVLLGLNEIPKVDMQTKILDPPILQRRIIESFCIYLSSLKNQAPVVLVIDDVQWLDDSSTELLKKLLRDTKPKGLLFIFLERATDDQQVYIDDILGDELRLKIYLNPLDYEDTELLVGILLKSDDLPSDLQEKIREKAEGNPFFVTEIVRGLIDEQQIIYQDDRWTVNPEIDSVRMPDTLMNLLMTRLDRLSEGSKYIAQSASVIGRQFYYKVLDCLIPSVDLTEHLSDLENREWIISDISKAEQAYFFKHLITKEVAYSSLLKKTRKELHTKIANCIESINSAEMEEIAHHFLAAEEYERAIPYVIKSATKARIANANQNSLQLLQQIEPVIDNYGFEAIHDVYVGLGETYAMMGNLKESQEQYEKLLEKSESSEQEKGVVSALNKMARNMLHDKENIAKADEILTKAEEIGSRLNFIEGIIENSAIRCTMYQGLGDLSKAADYEKRGIAMVGSLENDEMLLSFKHNLAISLMLSHKLGEALAQVKDMIEVATRSENYFRLSTTYGFLMAYIQFAQGEIKEAKESATLGHKYATQVDAPFALFLSLSNLGSLNVLQGYFEAATEYFIQGIDASALVSYFGLPAWIEAKTLIVTKILDLMSEEELEKKIAKIQGIMNVPYGDYWGAAIWSDLAYYYLLSGDFEEFDRYVDMVINKVTAPQRYYLGRVMYLKMVAAILQNNYDLAREIMNEHREALTMGQYKQYIPEIKLIDAILHYENDQYDQGLELMNTAREMAEATSRIPLLWQIHHYQSKYNTHKPEIAEESNREKSSSYDELLSRFTDEKNKEGLLKWMSGEMVEFENYPLVLF
ncbi:MAG: AAA family ATPase [Candidatus Kariarchaeaceae archaeon]|jgi:class 3 adenylate cyclase/tetratricopeptide (TPR) repeat protein